MSKTLAHGEVAMEEGPSDIRKRHSRLLHVLNSVIPSHSRDKCSWPVLFEPSTAFLYPVCVHGHRAIEAMLARLYRVSQRRRRMRLLERIDKVVRGFNGHLIMLSANLTCSCIPLHDELTSESSLPWTTQQAGTFLAVSRLSIACTPSASPKNSRYRPA